MSDKGQENSPSKDITPGRRALDRNDTTFLARQKFINDVIKKVYDI